MEQFLTIAIAHLLAVASPGPDFAIVLKQSVNGGVRTGLWTSAGVGTGIFLHVTYCLLGVALLCPVTGCLSSSTESPAVYLACSVAALGTHGGRRLVEADGAAATTRPASGFPHGCFHHGLIPKATLSFWRCGRGISPETPVEIQALYGLYLAWTFAFRMLSRAGAAAGARLRFAPASGSRP